ncbi:MAG: LacI family DNA-binding transcriptional regulator [Paludibacteraceae bacterium]|nr:LacI family DNA-binding transcriptional regulator [Paludibacteraceae bacterium]MBP6285202.1 LacI family DNA-binding transcriptional regulator [Paludibacteraceae bacterium]
MRAQITIKDIARALGVSASTVSRALQNHPDISKATTILVQEYAKTNHYKPNAVALSLKKQHSNIIGVVVPEMVHHFFSTVLSGIEDVANGKGYNVLVCQTSENYEKEVRMISSFITARVSGVIASISKETSSYEHFQELMDDNTPLVFFDRICTGINTDRVIIDDYTGAFSAVEYLIKTGCLRIAFFSAPFTLEISKNRKNGYLDALRKHGIQVDESLIYVCDSRQDAILLTQEILGQPNPPDAFFAINDNTASGILSAVKKAGFRVPDDISICGFGDGIIATTSDPLLTTVQQNGYQMGVEACNMLLNRIEKKTIATQFSHSLIRTNLVVRETTKPLSKKQL